MMNGRHPGIHDSSVGQFIAVNHPASPLPGTFLSTVDLVILDELGCLPFSQTGGDLVFHLISKLYERTSTLMTTNLGFVEWSTVFDDPK